MDYCVIFFIQLLYEESNHPKENSEVAKLKYDVQLVTRAKMTQDILQGATHQTN